MENGEALSRENGGDGMFCEDCGTIVSEDANCGDDVVRPLAVVDGQILCDRCARAYEAYLNDECDWTGDY